MAIEAVVLYWQRAGISEGEDVARVVAHAKTLGFAFTAEEHRTALQVRELIGRLSKDQTLRRQFLTSKAPISALFEYARSAGYDLTDEAIHTVIRALRGRHGELDAKDLEGVAGGVRLFLPEVDDEVLLAFEHGDVDRPVILGSLWNPKDKPPSGG